MITVTKRKPETLYNLWLNKCPHCNSKDEDSDVFVEISSEGLYTHFSLCKSCRKELANKLLNPVSEAK